MAAQANNPLGFDEQTLGAIQMSQGMQSLGAIGGNSAERMNDAAIFQGINTAFPSPQQQTAVHVQNALKQATLTQNEGETDMDFSMRQLKAQRDAVASLDPQLAATINSNLLKIGETKFEQAKLNKGLDIEQQKVDILGKDEGIKEQENQRAADVFKSKAGERKLESELSNYAYSVKPDKDAPLGFTATGYDVRDPKQTAAMAAAQQRGESLMAYKDYATLIGKADPASLRVAGELAAARERAGAPPDAELANYWAADCIFNTEACNRMSQQQKQAIEQAKFSHGINPADIRQAQAEIKGAQIALNSEERRRGNMQILEQSVPQLGNAVLNVLQNGITQTGPDGVARTYKVTRSDWTTLNGLIAGGKTMFSDPAEKAYQNALQGFVNEYTRVIAGGTGVSSDHARAEAWRQLSDRDGPAAIRAALQQMTQQELGAIMHGTDLAREVLANKSQYPTATKLLQQMGFNFGTRADEVASRLGGNLDATGVLTGQTPPPAAPQQSGQVPTSTPAAPTAQPVAKPPTWKIVEGKGVVPYGQQ